MTSAAHKVPYTTARPAHRPLDLLGIPVHPVGSREILAFMEQTIRRGEQAIIPYLNVYSVNMALSLSWLRDYFRECPLVFCDGDGVRLGLWMFGQAPPPKTTYNVWIWEMARWAERNGFSLYLLGGMPGIAEQAGRRLTEAFPKLRVAGTHDGYFQKQGAENERLIEEVNRLSPDVLLVCFGLPFQEEWTQKNASRLAAHILLTGGAALDYAAGRVAVAPGWVVRWHMEWLFRLWLEPVRMFRRYVLGNPLFLARVMRQMARQPRRSALD